MSGVENGTAWTLTAGQWSSSCQTTRPSHQELERGRGQQGGRLSNWEKDTLGWETLVYNRTTLNTPNLIWMRNSKQTNSTSFTWFHKIFTSYISSHQPIFLHIILNTTKIPIYPSPIRITVNIQVHFLYDSLCTSIFLKHLTGSCRHYAPLTTNTQQIS